MAIDLGDPVPLAVFVTDDLGAPANATAVVLSIALPDGTSATPAVTNAAPGTYTAGYATVQAGRHFVSWVATGTNACTFTDVFDVFPADPRFLISVDDALDACRFEKVAARDAAREQMALYVAAATPVIEDMTGPLIPEERTKVADGGRTAVLLPATDIAVVSVTVSGVLLAAATDYDVDQDAGIVYLRVSASGRGAVVIVYTVGSPVLPANLRLATREEVRYLWAIGQQQPRTGTSGAPDATVFTPSGFAVPRRVSELCAPHPRAPGFA